MYKVENISGAGLALLTIGIAQILPIDKAQDLFALILVAIASAYIGFALADGRPRQIIIEIFGVIAFCACAVIGLWFFPIFLPIGYFAHGIWDIVHHPHGIKTKVIRWYIPFCLIYDWLVSAYIIFWLIMNHAPLA